MNLEKLFGDPDVRCESEYRAIFDCLQDALDSLDGDESPNDRRDLVASVLMQFEDDAREMLKRLDAEEGLERELRLDEERIADQMTADELRGITAPEY